MNSYLPEGMLIHTQINNEYLSAAGLERALQEGRILEARAVLCDTAHNLIVDLNGIDGIIYRNDSAIGIETGETKEIAILSRVGKPVCFKVLKIEYSQSQKIQVTLSRRAAQEECLSSLLNTIKCGDVLPCVVTHLEHFGAFTDVGCGVISLIGVENISVSRIAHPSDRFHVGQKIFAAVLSIDYLLGRIALTHKELLGTWCENAALFTAGETVSGIVRGIKDYGIFIELTPNLSGLAEGRTDLSVGDKISVYIKAIIQNRMKIKLIAIDRIESENFCPKEPVYFISEGNMDFWQYSPNDYYKPAIITYF